MWSPIMARQTKTTETKTSSCPHCCKFPSRTLQKASLLITRSATLFANHELWTTFSSGLKVQSSLTVYTNRHAENWSFVGKKYYMNTGQITKKKICKRKSSITTKLADFYIWLANLVPDIWTIIHKIFFFLSTNIFALIILKAGFWLQLHDASVQLSQGHSRMFKKIPLRKTLFLSAIN